MPPGLHNVRLGLGALRARPALVAALLTGAGAAILAFVGLSTPTYTIDSYFYLVKARSLAAGLGPTVTWGSGVDPIFSSGYAFWLAPFVGLLGRDGWMAGNLAAYALAAVALWRLLAPLEAPSRLAAFGLAVLNPVWLQWFAIPMAEILLSASALWAILLALHLRRTGSIPAGLAAGLLAGVGFFSRPEGILLGPLVLGMAWPRLRGPRMIAVAAGAAALFLAPEGLHRTWLAARLPDTMETVGYLDVLRRHLGEIDLLAGARTLLEAPYHPTLEEIGEQQLYRAFIPPLLRAGQWMVEVLWLAALLLGLTAWRRDRSRALLALGFLAYAFLHGLWFYRYERFIAPLVPLAALLLARGLGDLATLARTPRAMPVAAALAMVVCALYGTQVGRLHAARLDHHQGRRDYRAAGEQAGRLAGGAPVVSEVGPYVAYDLPGPVLMEGARPDFHEDDVPDAPHRDSFLRQRGVAAVLTTDPRRWRLPGARVEAVSPGLHLVVLPE